MAVVADPQVNRLLTPADDAVELALQIEHQPIDKMEIVARHGRVLNAQQVRLQLIPCRIQRILQFAQGAGGFRQQQFTAGNRRAPVFIQQLRDIVFHQLLLLIHNALRQVDAVENFRYGVLQRRKNVAMPVEFITALFRGIRRALQLAGNDRQLHRETQRREFALSDIIIGDPNPQRRQAIDRIAFGNFAGKAVQQTLAHQIVDRVIGALADGFAGLLKRITDVAERIHQFTLAHFPFQSFTIQSGDRQQERESVDR